MSPMPNPYEPPKKRRWFQFGLRWLFLLPVVFGLCYWWFTLPTRTLETFNRLVVEGRYDDAEKMVRNETDWTIEVDADGVRLTDSFVGPTGRIVVVIPVPIELDEPSFTDVILARRKSNMLMPADIRFTRGSMILKEVGIQSIWERVGGHEAAP